MAARVRFALARRAERDKLPIGIVCQLNPDEENPAVTTGLYKVWHCGRRAQCVGDARRHSSCVRAFARALPHNGAWEGTEIDALCARVKPVEDIVHENSDEFDTLVDLVRTTSANALKDSDPAGIGMGMAQYDDQVEIINFLCTNLPFEAKAKSDLLAKSKIIDRAMGLADRGKPVCRPHKKLTENIMKRARRNMEENQKTPSCNSRWRRYGKTLYGDESTEADELLDRAEQTALPDSVMTNVRKGNRKLRRYNPTTHDITPYYTHISTRSCPCLGANTPPRRLQLQRLPEILENDHYGLEKVKERIVEQLALLMHNPDGKSPILCLYVAPPGVGKTSIGKSVAKALGRKYERVSFRRPARRGRDPRSQAYIYRCDARPHNRCDEACREWQTPCWCSTK